MRRLYRIRFAPQSPKLTIRHPVSNALVTAFQGESLAALSPHQPFVCFVEGIGPWSQIYSCGEDAIAFTDAAWENCEEMYHVVGIGGSEMLAAQAGDTCFSVVNALDFAPAARHAGEPFDLAARFYAPIFRIHACPNQIFCLGGTVVPGDEFKHAYEAFGFAGLIFEEIWTETSS